ncbi:FAD/NAD(P)-binding domain-containing protein [Periconia macrospinosa]|uniref:FAD/NAD(P)-binding domain-containing protein n=1 Tax=Periconia macrospinosa TaxID=97972 RepID=A0A2V1CYB4_9PLEO|nr:FAD/NAD(P)-binding domain-containing protein [Periconia macrospinosa]
MATLDVIIIGGGLAGSCLANGLLNKAKDLVNVAIYERDQRNSKRDGYQIRLGSYALMGFRECLTESQYTDLLLCFGRSGGVVSSAPAIFDTDMKLVLDLSKFPAYHKSAPIGRARLRNLLQAPLLEQNVIHHGKTFVQYEVVGPEGAPDRKIRAHFSDGSSADCDILISAEGSGSRINKQLGCCNIIDPPETESGSVLGKCHVPWSVLRDLPHALVEKGSIYTAGRRCKLFSALYLPDNFTSPQQKASRQPDWSEEEPSHYDETQASLMVGLTWTGGLSPREIVKLADPKGYMRQQLAEAKWHPDFMKLIDAIELDALQAVPLRQAKDTPVDWRRRTRADKVHASNPEIAHPRVWLIGDSFHPMLPTRGMGANNAIRDTADILGPLVELALQKKARGQVTDEEARAQLAVYENAMIPRAMGWVKTSAQQDLPDLDTIQGRIITFGVRLLLSMVSVVMQVAGKLGWKPRDEAPELP